MPLPLFWDRETFWNPEMHRNQESLTPSHMLSRQELNNILFKLAATRTVHEISTAGTAGASVGFQFSGAHPASLTEGGRHFALKCSMCVHGTTHAYTHA